MMVASTLCAAGQMFQCPVLTVAFASILQASVNVSIVLISRTQPAALGLLALLPGLVPIPFPAYTDTELVNILAVVSDDDRLDW